MNPDTKIFKDKLAIVSQVTSDLQDDTRSKTGKYYLALAGGSTPRAIYEQWATIGNESLWNTVHFFWGDERCVAPSDEDSNFKMAYDSLLSKITIAENQIHRIHGEENPEVEIPRYEEEIKQYLPIKNNFPQFDWILLGIGTDGHTASLFPNSEALKEQDSVCVVAHHPRTGQKRISLTLPVINNAKKVTFIVTGDEKAQIAHEIFSHSGEFAVAEKSKSSDYPAAQVKPQRGILQWYLDEPAASLL